MGCLRPIQNRSLAQAETSISKRLSEPVTRGVYHSTKRCVEFLNDERQRRSDRVEKDVEGVIDRHGRFLLNPVASGTDQGRAAEVGAARPRIGE